MRPFMIMSIGLFCLTAIEVDVAHQLSLSGEAGEYFLDI